MKVLVTGANGFIGFHLINELIFRGLTVIATDIQLEKSKQEKWGGKVIFVPHRIEGSQINDNLFEKFLEPDLLIQLAWKGLPNYTSVFHFEENLPEQYFFIKNLAVNGLNNITVAGTCLEYGMKTGCLREDMLPEPGNAYAIAKNTLRLFLRELQNEVFFSLKWPRLFYLFGAGQNPKSLIAQLDMALQNGDKYFNMSGGGQIRDYLPVEQAATYLADIALQNRITGIINCCSNEPLSIKAFVEKYLETKGKTIALNLGYYPYPAYEPMEFWGDNTKLKTIIRP